MNTRKINRLITILVILSICSSGVYIILSNLSDNIVFFYPPSEIPKTISNTEKIRVGGLVKQGSIQKIASNKILFTVEDNKSELQIEYEGITPALFREKQGIVAEGKFSDDHLFIASKLLSKHDENYRPPAD